MEDNTIVASCSLTECIYNAESKCVKDAISIGGAFGCDDFRLFEKM